MLFILLSVWFGFAESLPDYKLPALRCVSHRRDLLKQLSGLRSATIVPHPRMLSKAAGAEMAWAFSLWHPTGFA
jgi:hypothetical protein